jgi:hypothetical protein
MSALREARTVGDEVEQIRLTRELSALVPPGVYIHNKSTDEHPLIYVVTGVSIEPSTLEAIVAYTFLYGPRAGLSMPRSLLGMRDGFITPVQATGIPRFKRVVKLSVIDAAKLQSNAWRIAGGKTLGDIQHRIRRALDPNLAR